MSDQLVASLRRAAASRLAPASISAARPARPPSYWSMTSDRTAASIRRHIASAFRARCVRTWPTDQPGSFEARLTSASPRSATTDLSRSCATRHPSMSAWGLTVFGGRTLGIICVLFSGWTTATLVHPAVRQCHQPNDLRKFGAIEGRQPHCQEPPGSELSPPACPADPAPRSLRPDRQGRSRCRVAPSRGWHQAQRHGSTRSPSRCRSRSGARSRRTARPAQRES